MANTRYIRYIIFSLFIITLVFFITSSSTSSQVTHHIQSTTNTIKDSFKKSPSSPKIQFQPESTVKGHELEDKAGLLHHEDETSLHSSHPVKPLKPQKGSSSKTNGRANATFVTLARNHDLYDLAESIKQVEDRFNHRYNYDWVFLNEIEFDEEFKRVTTNLVSGRTRYGVIPEEHWSFPEWIDQNKAAKVREDMHKKKIIYGDSESYRHMCRFESGFFFRQPLMLEYEYYWRVEPGIKYFCDIDYDVFKYMADNKKKYSFTISLYEYKETIETLWNSVKTFIKEHPEHIADDNSMDFISDNNGKDYNLCHFWSNFEIGNLDWLRSDAYLDYFNRLDKDGGFFYERWGDAPVHSIAAALLLQKDEIHFFEDIGYWHVPFHHCPNDEKTRLEKKCRCDPGENFDWNGYSCTAKYFDLHGLEHPAQT